jgi:hypothetical protein
VAWQIMQSPCRHPRESGGPQAEAATARPGIAAFAGTAIGFVAPLLAGCHGGTLDAIYPGEFGHRPPPAVNLPPQDAGLEQR